MAEIFFSVPESARALRCDVRTVRTAIAEGRIRAIRLNKLTRIPRSEILRLLGVAEGETPPELDADLRKAFRQFLPREVRRKWMPILAALAALASRGRRPADQLTAPTPAPGAPPAGAA